MISLTPRVSRINHGVFVLAVVCLGTVLAGVVFVGARRNDGELLSHTLIQPDASTKAKIADRFGQLPLSFEINKGQTNEAVRFLSHGPNYDLFLTANEAVLSLQKPRATEKSREGSVLRLKMIGANATPRIEGRDELPGKVNYFSGNNPNKWRRNIPTYRKVHYKDVYPGIDVVYYGNQQQLEYDFVVAPGANPKLIKFRVEGAQRIRLDKQGNLLLALKDGEVRLNKPFIYQLTGDGSRSEVKGSYQINGNEVRFKVRGADSSKPLVIDPVLSYSTFLGGTGPDEGVSIAVDAQGSAYVTGSTLSPSFPTTPGVFKTSDIAGVFITKLDPTGTTLVYSTRLFSEVGGIIVTGTPFTATTAIAVDSTGNAYVTGSTTDPDLPLINPLKTSGHLFKTTDGALNWTSTSTGLTGTVNALAIAPNNPNTMYAATDDGTFRSGDAGATWTIIPDFGPPITIAVDPTNSSVVYFGSAGLLKSTDGGANRTAVNLPTNNPGVRSIAFDPSTPATMYVGSDAGVFRSTDSGSTWTTLNNFGLPAVPNVNALVIDATATSTIYAGTSGGAFKTTNGGSSWTPINNGLTTSTSPSVNAIVIDPFNSSTLYATVGFSTLNKSTNGGASWAPVTSSFPTITAIAADRTTPSTLYVGTFGGGVFKTTNGGASFTRMNTGLWDGSIRLLVTHPSSSIVFAGGVSRFLITDAFVTELNSTGSELLFSTYLGGSGNEIGNGIAVDGSGNIYVAGHTQSENFPAVNGLPSTISPTDFSGSAFVTKLNPAAPSYVFSTYLGGSKSDEAHSIAIDQAANVYVTGNTNSADFPLANAFQSTIGDSFNGDAFVTKLNSNGSLSYSTFLGGSNSDTGFGIAVDVSGNAYVTGVTRSNNFPTANPIQATYGGSLNDAFVTKLNAQGSALVYSTYLGGLGSDNGRGIAVDVNGNAYVTGFTSSFDFPVVAGALRTRSVMFKSTDTAADWSNDNYGLNASSITHVVVHPTQPATVYAATTLGVFRSTNAGKTWSAINNGLTGHFVTGLVIDPATPSTLYVSAGTDSGSVGGVYKSTDGGNSWNLRKNGMTNVNLLSLAIDPVTPTTLYAGASGGPIYKTTDGADNWAPSGNVPPFFPVWLAVDPHSPTRIFAADSAGMFRSIDSGATWQSVGVNQTGTHAGFVGVSPDTPGLVYATTDGNGLFKSVDGGDNWTSVRPQSRFARVVFDPVSSSTLYLVSTSEGVLKSTDNGQSWMAMNNGLTTPSATALAIHPIRPSTLYLVSAATFDEDAFVTRIDPSGSTLVYSTLIGGVPVTDDSFLLNDEAFAIAIDSAGNAYVTGVARSPDFPATPNSFQPVNLGFGDSFITKLSASYIISGHVFDGGTPLSGAEVVLSAGATLTAVITDSDGSYEFSHLREGGSFTVSAAKAHFTMAPPGQTFSNLNSNQTLDFAATATNASFFTISGQVTENGSGLSGVTVTLSGSQPGIRITDDNGNYSFELAGGGNYTVTPSLNSFTFGPPSQTFNNLSAPQTANFGATRPSFVVTNANNHGGGSLREAISNANATPGTDKIVFNIPGPGVKVINLLTALPEITGPVVIDATTQPGYAGAPLIELNGASVPFEPGLVITAGNTTVRGLAIGSFPAAGIVLRACDNNVIQGNRIGTDAAGSLPRPNNIGILLTDSSNNVIGGTSAAARNVISGNVTHGVEIGGSNNVVAGNFIGTNAAGNAAIGNGSAGVRIPFSTRTNNLIGGATDGAGNLISGNATGIDIESAGNTIQGNLIGTDITGFSRIHNLTGIDAKSPDTLIGGLTREARNIISGNSTGVSLRGDGSRLQGNYIGTDIFGSFPLGNSNNGVVAGDKVLIGGTTAEARNVISANGGFGNVVLGLSSFGPGATVQGNYIGTDVSGAQALSESTVAGIAIFSSGNLIGGTVPGAQNVISGNQSGIQLGSFNSGPPQENTIQGNLIGLDHLGVRPIPNTAGGIEFFDSFNNTVGGTQDGAANKIAFNGGPGVGLFRGTRNSVRGNSIFSNAGLGIDLVGDGVTANDSTDSDAGANNLQNFPVLTSVTSSANSTTIQGSLKSTPNKTFDIDFYSSAALDPSGNGEGARFFNTAPVTTDGNGDASFNVTFSMALGTGRVLTATATDQNGNTSEFSAGDATGAGGNLQFSVDAMKVIEDVGFATITVVRKGGSVGTLTVEYTSTAGTATAGQDYVPPFGFLTFNSGETSKSFQIPIADDVATEPDETFEVQLSAGNPETLGAPINLLVTIQDRTTDPVISQGKATVVEGNSGTTDALFTFSLSAATGRTVTVNYFTQNFTASGGASCSNPGTDYETASGTIVFQPRVTAVTIPVKVCGDTSAEPIESFRIVLSNTSNAALGFPQALGTITDDDILELLREDSGPTVNQAAALDALLMLRDPFRVVGIPEWATTGPDRNTRVMFFVRGLQLDPGELPSAVVVRLTRSNGQFIDVTADDVRPVPDVDFAQLVIRVPDTLLADVYTVSVRAHSRISNTGTIRIAP